jgi:hypothetical protein
VGPDGRITSKASVSPLTLDVQDASEQKPRWYQFRTTSARSAATPAEESAAQPRWSPTPRPAGRRRSLRSDGPGGATGPRARPAAGDSRADEWSSRARPCSSLSAMAIATARLSSTTSEGWRPTSSFSASARRHSWSIAFAAVRRRAIDTTRHFFQAKRPIADAHVGLKPARRRCPEPDLSRFFEEMRDPLPGGDYPAHP